MEASDPESQYGFRAGLTWLNTRAELANGKRFMELSAMQQTSLLESLELKDLGLKDLRLKEKTHPGDETGRPFLR
jgi:hypothetical protein